MKIKYPLYWMPRYKKQLNEIESLIAFSGYGLKALLDRVISEVKLFRQEQEDFETLNEKAKQQDSRILELEKELESKSEEFLTIVSQNDHKVEVLLNTQKKESKEWADKIMEILDYTDYASVNDVLAKENILEAVRQRTEEMINRMGIFSLNETGGTYDNNFQQIVTIRETENPDLHNKVYASLKRGFKINEKCIREQEVIIYKLKS